MSGAYIVLVIDDNVEIRECETYPGFESASKKAIEFAYENHCVFVDDNPQEIDGCWNFVNGNDLRVCVLFRQMNDVPKPIPNNNSGVYMSSWQYGGAITTQVNPVIIKPMDYPMEDTLPAGFSLTDKPLTIADLIADPYQVKHTRDLTDNQKWALITARIRKRPNFLMNVGIFGVGYVSQSEALDYLKAKDQAGLIIRDHELKMLDEILEQELNKNAAYDCT